MAYEEFGGELDKPTRFEEFTGQLDSELPPAVDTGDDMARMLARNPAPKQPGLVARVANYLKPEYKSVMAEYQPTAQELQAEKDRRLSYGAGPISGETAAAADLVRSGMAETKSPTVKKVAKAMKEQGTPSFGDLVQRAKDPESLRAAREAKADEFRTAGEWALDTLSNVSQGTVGLVQLPINIIAPSSEIAETLRDTQKELQAAESDVLKANRDRLKERVLNEDGFLDKYVATAKELVTNPTLTIAEAAKQIPNFLGVVAAARLAGATAAGGVSLAGRASPTLALGEAISGGAIQTAARALGTSAGGAGASMVMAGGDAAGGTYEKLTDRNQTPLSVWEKNDDFKRLVAEGKTVDQAIEEIATTKARMAALITAPLGLLGYMGAESAIASRGLGRATAEAITAKGMAKTAVKDLIGEQLEEGGTQLGSNVFSRTVDPSQSLTEGVPEAMATALVTSAPFTAAGLRSQYTEASAPQAADIQAERMAVDRLDPQSYDRSLIGAAQPVRGAADVGPSAPARTLNFTAPDSPTSQAGLTPITVPVPSAAAGTDAVLAAVGAGQALPPTVGAGQSPAALARPFDRATDQDLLTRTEAAIGGQENNNAVPQATEQPPVQQWFGRKGDGYATEADALQAIAGRQRMFKDLDWKVELMPSGKFRLAGYEQNVQVPTEASTTAATGGGLPAAGSTVPAVEAAGVDNSWAMQQYGTQAPGITRAKNAEFGLQRLREELQQTIDNPAWYPNKQDYANTVSDLSAKIKSIEDAIPKLNEMDRRDDSDSLQRFMLGTAKQELDAAVQSGSMSQDQATQAIERARATGNTLAAVESIENAVDRSPALLQQPATSSGQTNGTQAPQAIQSQAQGQEVLAASAKQPGDLNLPQGPLPDADVARLGSNPQSASVRFTVQQNLNRWAASSGATAPQLGKPDADAETTVNVLGALFGDTTGIGRKVVAYSEPGGHNGFTYGGFAFVNTAPDTDVSAPRTTLHEIRHVIERIARADTKAGRSNTPAQQFVQSIDSIFDEMTDVGKRAYVENFLHKADLAKIADPAKREAAIQKYLASPLLRSEMTADFLGNRAQDRAFLIDLARQDPGGFEGFVQRWLAVIDNLLAKLRGSKDQGRKESAKVDQYVRDLNKAKMVARDALIAFRKGNLDEVQTAQTAAGSQLDAPSFSFAGERSQVADKHALTTAQQRLDEGENAETVRQDTGWFKGADGKWRYEISDSDASPQYPGNFLDAVMAAYRDGSELSGDPAYKVTLSDVLRHPALFAAYPQLKGLEVQFMDKGVRAKGRMETGTVDGVAVASVLKIREDLPADEWMSVMLHEVQHGIQNIEGFARGGSIQAVEDILDDLRAERGRVAAYASAGSEKAAKRLEEIDREISSYGNSSSEGYLRLAGEVEARNTQARRNLTDAERRAMSPSQTADVADTDVIVVFSGKEMDNAPAPANAPTMSRRQASAIPAGQELITVHNLTAENLRAADELGGLPAPSLAISKASAPLQGFGEITLIGDTALATPSAKNPVFDADVYSPRFPDVRVKVDEGMVRAAIKPLADAAQAAGMSPRSADSAIDEMARNRMSNAIGNLTYDTALRLGYANAVLGKNLTVPTKQVEDKPVSKAGGSIIEQSPLREALATLDVGQLTPETAGDLGQKVYSALINKTLADMGAEASTAEGFTKAMKMVNLRINIFAETTIEPGSTEFEHDKVGKMTDKGLYALYNLTRNTPAAETAPAGPRTELDTVALSETLDREAPREQFTEWLREQLRPAMGVRRIVREGGATAPFSLANIVREMTRKVRDAEGFNYGLGNARSKGATKFKNLKQIQGQRDRVVSKEKFEAARKEIDAEFSELANQVAPFQQYKGDSSIELLAEAIGNSYSVPLEQALKDAALVNVPGDLQARIAEFAGALVNAPTEYFEAKPQRAVTLDEFRGAVVPKGLVSQAAEILAKNNLETIEYDPKQAGDREAKVAELAAKLNDETGDILFSPRQAEVDQDPELITIFEGLQSGRGLKGVRAREAAAAHPLGDAIQKVHNDFYDILERLDNAGLIEINC